jgi:hypothetical protein
LPGKPTGLWISDDADDECSWPRWCRDEQYHLGSLALAHDIVLKPTARLIWLCSVKDIDRFHGRFRSQGQHVGWRWIDWGEVARHAEGIVITPYQWERRLDGEASDWYYSWDCASGCIWDASAVEAIVPVSEREAEAKR